MKPAPTGLAAEAATLRPMDALQAEGLRQLLAAATYFGARCALWGAIGVGLGIAAGAVAAVALQLVAARPLLRWGLGPSGAASCLSAVLLVAGGVLGGAWTGGWLGAARCVHVAVHQRYLLEDAALRGLVHAATSGEEHADVAEAIRHAIDDAGGSLAAFADDVRTRVGAESLDVELPSALSGDGVRELATALEERGLVDARHLAGVHRVGGFRAALNSGDDELAGYAQRVLDATATVRDQLGLAVDGLVWPNAIGGIAAGLGVPLLLAALLATAARLAGMRAPPPSRQRRSP